MAFPSHPRPGEVWVEGGRSFIFDERLPGWRLLGSMAPTHNPDFGNRRLTQVAGGINNTDAVNLGQLKNMVEPIQHHQSNSASTWNITHNLDRQFVSIQVIDHMGDTIIPDIEYLTSHTARLLFTSPVQGTAVIRR